MKKAMIILAIGLSLMPALAATTAEDVLDKAAKAAGGEALKNVESMVTEGKMTMSMGMSGKVITMFKKGGKIYSETEMTGQMPIKNVQACDGTDCYTENSMQGTRMMSEEEKSMLTLQSDPTLAADWRNLYKEYEYLGTEEIDGKTFHKLDLTTKDGTETTCYYNTENYYLEIMEMSITGPMGNMEMRNVSSDFRNVDGVVLPFKMDSEVPSMGMTINLELTQVEINVPIPDSQFEIPAHLKQ